MSEFKKVNTLTTSLEYRDTQYKVLAEAVKWANDPTAPLVLVIKGAAGSGKTTILNDIIRNCRVGTIGCTAPTHKAVEVIKQSTGRPGLTIQKIIGLKPNVNIDNFDINNPKFSRFSKGKMEDYNMLIIDEASMINTDLKTILISESKVHDCKLLFVGDPYQLPPVNEISSSVFKHSNVLELTEIVRQADGNKLLDLLKYTRKCIEEGNINFIRHLRVGTSRISEDGSGFEVLNKVDFTKRIDEYFTSDNFRSNINYCRYSAFTNFNILGWNKYIRSITVGKDDKSESILVAGDFVTAYSTIVDEFLSPIITNSEDYLIDNNISDYRNQLGVRGFLATLTSVTTGVRTKPIFIVDHTKEDSFHAFMEEFNIKHSAAKRAPVQLRSSNWSKYYKFKNANLLLTSISDDRGTLIVSKDLDYGYGITIHKTQGSTYDNIFVNLSSILMLPNGMPNKDLNLIARLFYVAISRARHRVVILLDE